MSTWGSAPSRAIRDAAGTQWRVFEMPTERVPDAPRVTCLIADSAGATRRVWDYPDDWRALPDAELLAVIERPVPQLRS
jgi:hypothetical protein